MIAVASVLIFVGVALGVPAPREILQYSLNVHAIQNNSIPFDVKVAAVCVELSAAAYCQNSVITDWSCPPCVNSGLDLKILKILYAKTTDTHGYVGISAAEKLIVVAFQGTHDLQQWIDDLSFFKTDLHYPGAGSDVKVHGGFYKAYQEVQSDVGQVVNSTLAAQPGYSILVTGHSLGAAIAAMCSLDLALTHRNVRVQHYTFGQPRVGNAAFAQFYRDSPVATAYRMTHNRDIVPHLPLEAMGFQHIPTEVFYKENYTGPDCLRVCNGSGEDPNCADQFDVDISISDHLNYMGRTLDTDACTASLAPFQGISN